MSELAIELVGVRHAYAAEEVLKGIDLRVPWGQICGYLGPNGAGKSTTLRILSGLLQPTAGEARVAGHAPTASLAARAQLGYVPDSGGLYGLLSGREHLALVSDLHDLSAERFETRMTQLDAALDLKGLLDQRIDTLSKGQRQRIALACGLLHGPKVLLLDEPLSGLDARAARSLRDLLQHMASEGCAILYCSHILDVVERVCDRAVILFEGEVVADAPTSELVSRSKGGTLEAVFHSLTRSRDIEGLQGAFSERGR